MFLVKATTGHFVTKRLLLIVFTRLIMTVKIPFVKICILPLLHSLAGVCSFIRRGGNLATAV